MPALRLLHTERIQHAHAYHVYAPRKEGEAKWQFNDFPYPYSPFFKPFNCIEGEGKCKFAAATKSKLIAHMMNLHSMSHLAAKKNVDQREFDLTIPEDFEASPRKANIAGKVLEQSSAEETPPKSNKKKTKKMSAKKLPDPTQNPRKAMALGADVSGLGTPAAGRVGPKRKVRRDKNFHKISVMFNIASFVVSSGF